MSMKSIIQAIRKNKKFLISTHVNPDPDALCSELALAMCLRAAGKKVSIINQDEMPKQYGFLSGSRSIRSYNECKHAVYDVAIIVDCGDLGRIGKVRNLIQEDKILINIDHHITNDSFGDLNLVKPKASSTAEVLYDLLKKARFGMTKSIATHLYIGIMTDTGSFRYENTTARTHEIVSELLRYKISVSALYRRLYEIISIKDLKEFTRIINSFDMFLSGRVVCVRLRKGVLAKITGEFDLKDMIFKFLRAIKGVEVFVIFTEIKKDRTRVNLRSTNRFDVAKLANVFDGGGHRRASGCMIKRNIAGAQQLILKEIRKVL